MSNLFPIVESASEILDSLEKERGCFIKNRSLCELGKQTFTDSTRVFNNTLQAPLDEKTMFPSKIKSLPNVERQVIQQYFSFMVSKPATNDVALLNKIIGTSHEAKDLSLSILKEAQKRYNWSEKLYTDVCNQVEWTLNVARYPFEENKYEQVLFPAHKDWGLFAIYPLIHGSGLEVYLPELDGCYKWRWLDVPPDCAFCYAGDIFAKVTDNKVKPLTHRVRQPGNQAGSRTSIIFYVDPPRDMILPNGLKVGDIIDSKLKKIGQIS